jgi:hypothetical protein
LDPGARGMKIAIKFSELGIAAIIAKYLEEVKKEWNFK